MYDNLKVFGPNPTWEDGRLILSTPDAIGKAMDDYLNEKPEAESDSENANNVQKIENYNGRNRKKNDDSKTKN